MVSDFVDSSTKRQRRSANVFVVDDEWVIASTLDEILKINGFHSRFFVEPLEALRAAKSESPDILISDIAMRGLSGVELALCVKELCPDCKVLLFSGQENTIDWLKPAREKGHEFPLIPKPVLPVDLLAYLDGLSEDGPTATER